MMQFKSEDGFDQKFARQIHRILETTRKAWDVHRSVDLKSNRQRRQRMAMTTSLRLEGEDIHPKRTPSTPKRMLVTTTTVPLLSENRLQGSLPQNSWDGAVMRVY